MTNDNRVPAGSPEGGQFAAGANAETMTDEMLYERTGLTPQDVIDGCRKLGVKFAKRSPGLLDAEEIAGRTMEEFMKAVRSDKPIDNARSYLKTKAHGVAVHGVVGTSRGPDIKAVGEWLTRRTEWENEHNDRMPDSMSNALANQVREEFIERGEQPPTIDFHMRSRHMAHASLDAMTTDDDGRRRDHIDANSTLGAMPMAEASEAHRSAEVDALIRTHEQASADMKTKARKASAQESLRQTYTGVYEALGDENTPSVRHEFLSTTAATKFTSTVKKAGGAYAVAERIVEGESTMDERMAFMAPFGQGRTDAQAESAANTLLRTGKNGADKTWGALMQTATEKSPRSRPKWSSKDAAAHADRLGTNHRKLAATILTQRGDFTPEGRQNAKALIAPWRHADVSERAKALHVLAKAKSDEDAKAIWEATMAMETE